MNEQIFLGGKNVIGFGDAPAAATDPSARIKSALEDAFFGAAAGATLGALIGKKTGAMIGAAVGAVGVGAVTYALSAPSTPPASPPATPPALPPPATPATPAPTPTTTPVWRQLLQPTDSVKAGEEMAVAILGPNRAPLSPDLVAQLDAALALIPSAATTTLIAKYPPGSPPPANDWPSDYVAPPGAIDDFGPGAYRVLIRALIDSPPTFWHSVPSNIATFGIWAR